MIICKIIAKATVYHCTVAVDGTSIICPVIGESTVYHCTVAGDGTTIKISVIGICKGDILKGHAIGGKIEDFCNIICINHKAITMNGHITVNDSTIF